MVPRKVTGCTCAACTGEAFAHGLPEPQAAGDQPQRQPRLPLIVGSALVMCLGASSLIISFLVIAVHRADETLAPAWTLDGLRWGMITFVAGLAVYAACLLGLRIREARL